MEGRHSQLLQFRSGPEVLPPSRPHLPCVWLLDVIPTTGFPEPLVEMNDDRGPGNRCHQYDKSQRCGKTSYDFRVQTLEPRFRWLGKDGWKAIRLVALEAADVGEITLYLAETSKAGTGRQDFDANSSSNIFLSRDLTTFLELLFVGEALRAIAWLQ
ncbi:hypothetical protein VTL71DRAFT_2784 [Oculimacula yallundae]|uniref:Uncharacterized protein n=1 Tax=Oculimacula yallundae TaxID=86028 RepID=A0ABR4C9U0_9HELO